MRTKKNKKFTRNKNKLRIVPLGGIGEIGKNMFAVHYGKEIIVLDAGLMFPEEEMLGVDMVIPDISYLIEHQDQIKAIILTHGHEDHIGALPYVLRKINAPIYGTRLTLGLVEIKLEEHGLLDDVLLNEVGAGDELKIGAHEVRFFATNHSIPDTVGVALKTPVGNVVYTSDFKFDHTPVHGRITDFHALASLGKEGVLVALSDSTNAELPGYTPSEREIGETLNNIFCSSEGRVITVTFASNVHRIQQIIDAARKSGRKLVVDGLSMIKVVDIAQRLGYLDVPSDMVINVDDVSDYPAHGTAILTTGTQGEPMSALTRLSNKSHRKLEIIPGDTVVIAATPIPGNEKLVSRTIDNLFRQGAEVIYEKISGIHVSGHGSQEELKLMLNLLRPTYLIPVHGEYRHLIHHAKLAETMGISKENTLLVENGTVLEFDTEQANITYSVSSGGVFVDGLGVGDVGNVVLRDRQSLSSDGIFIVVTTIDSKLNKIVSGPDIVSRGFVYVKESEMLLEEARENVSKLLEELMGKNVSDWSTIKNKIKESMTRFLWNKTGRRPMILPIIMEI